MKITFTEIELRGFAEACFDFGVNGHLDSRTGEDLFIKLVEDKIKVSAAQFDIGDKVKVVVTGPSVPSSIKHDILGTVTSFQSTANDNPILFVQLGEHKDDGWYFGLDGVLRGFKDCRIEKV